MTKMQTSVPPAAPDPTQIQVTAPEAATVTVTGAAGSVEPNAVLIITNTRSGESVMITANSDGSFTAQIGAQAVDTLEIRVRDAAGNRSETRSLPVGGSSGGLPPDPATLAPPLAETEITPLYEATAFLYSGANPIQTGVAEGTLEPKRAAVVRGRVLNGDNQPLSGVIVTIKDHPEFGETRSRADGRFDMAVNGGGLLTLNYEKPGHLPVQRQVQTPWQDFAIVDDVVMVALDAKVTTIDLAGGTAMQVAQGSTVTDVDGSRQATVLFLPGTAATMTLPDGSQQVLTTLHVRATEYTVGANGPKTMPGPLPPTSGYTYAVELSVDEAIAAGATRVDFNQPLPVYIDNFLDFPVGGIVPVGWYDRDQSAWMPSDNGRIVQVLGLDTDGLARLDTEGHGQAADVTRLTELGITDAERARLALLFPAGKSLWRVPITHFTPWDCNWPYGPPEDSEPPPPEEPEAPDADQPDPEDSDDCSGCSIEAQSRTLGEEISITGTPFKLHYRSDRVPGRLSGSGMDIPLTGNTLPVSLKRIDLTIDIAGRRVTQSFAPSANLKYHFVWDRKDAYGRSLSAKHTATVDITFVYPAVYYESSGFARAFAAVSSRTGGTGGGAAIGRSRATGEITLGKRWKTKLAGPAPLSDGFGGWSLSAHHAYAVPDGELFTGDGGKRSAAKLFNTITTVAGNGSAGFSGDGGPASHASLNGPAAIALGPEGSLYIADTGNHRIRRVGPDGIIRTVAGNGGYGFSGDGGPALQASLSYPSGVAVSAEGSLYIADTSNHRVRRIAPDGIITTVAGNGTRDFSGDGGLASQASLAFPVRVAVGAEGSLYIADTGNYRVRRVGADGIVTTVAGNGGFGSSAISLGADGSLYISDHDNGRIRRVGLDGIITTVAGNGSYGVTDDGRPATQASLPSPTGIALGVDGSLYISDAFYHLIRRVGPDGLITTVAGNGSSGFSGDGGPARQASQSFPSGIALGADGSLYIADSGNSRIRRVALPFPGFTGQDLAIASEEGTALYRFDARGRHLRTEDTLTGHTLYRFDYDAAGLLVQITDLDGEVTHIRRDGSGHPSAIIAPDGQRTTLTLDPNGYLASVTGPAGERHTLEYTPEGLLTAFTDPNGHTDRFEYDILGRLTKNTNAGGGGWTLTRTKNAQGYTNTMTTAEGRTTTFAVEPLPSGDREQVNTYPGGTFQTKLFKTSGEETTTAPDGTVTTVLEGPDPRFGMLSPVPASVTTKLPSGLTATRTTARQATLADATDPLSLIGLTETRTVNGKTFTDVYRAATRTWTSTSAAGREATRVLDDKGRTIRRQTPGLEAAQYTYDPRGRLTSVTRGSGMDVRTTHIGYDAQGDVGTMTDALGRDLTFEHDPAGRITRQTLPDGRAIGYTYDPNGNVTSITPPAQPPHVFEYTPLDLEAEYVPPPVDAGDPATRYRYDRDRQLTAIRRPDGQRLDFAYDNGGHLSRLILPEGEYHYVYEPTTGQVSGITAPDGGTLSYRHDGALLTGTTWAGIVSGSITRRYNRDFNITEVAVNGTTVPFDYDPDGLLSQAGDLILTRDAQNGLLTGTTLGHLNDSLSYNGFGELATQHVAGFESLMVEIRTRVDTIHSIVGSAFEIYPRDLIEATEGLPATLPEVRSALAALEARIVRSFRQSHPALAEYRAEAEALMNLLSQLEAQDGTVTTTLYEARYRRDALGRITEKVETLGGITTTHAYTYDLAGRLAEVKENGAPVSTYGYDGNGNRTHVNGVEVAHYDAQDRLLDYAGTSYAYTPNGELASKTTGAFTTRYDYDVLGNLQSVALPDGRRIDYLIDGQNRRIGKKVNGTLVQGLLYQDQLRNRDGKKGKKQIVIGLLTDAQGWPITVEVFPGNTHDSQTLEPQIDKLVQRFGVERVTFVGDRGMIKSAQISDLEEAEFHYITAITKPQIEALLKTELFQWSMFDEGLVEIITDNVRYLLRRNPQRAEEIAVAREAKLESLGKYLAAKNVYLAEHPRARVETTSKKVQDKAERLQIDSWAKIKVDGRTLSVEADEQSKRAVTHLDGCYVIKTDLPREAASPDIVHARYKGLAEVEYAFRTMKTTLLEMRGIFVRKANRTRAHVFIIMLAYLLAYQLRRLWRDIELTLEEGIAELASICAIELTLSNQTTFQTIPEPRPLGKLLLAKAGITLPDAIPHRGTTVVTRKKLVPERRPV